VVNLVLVIDRAIAILSSLTDEKEREAQSGVSATAVVSDTDPSPVEEADFPPLPPSTLPTPTSPVESIDQKQSSHMWDDEGM